VKNYEFSKTPPMPDQRPEKKSKRKKLLTGLFLSILAAGIAALAVYAFVIYPRIRTWEPTMISLNTRSPLPAEAARVQGITPFGRTFYYYQYDKQLVFSNGYAFYSDVEIVVDTACMKDIDAIVLSVGSRQYVYPKENITQTWRNAGCEGRFCKLALPEEIKTKQFFNALFSVVHWIPATRLTRAAASTDPVYLLFFALLILILILTIRYLRRKKGKTTATAFYVSLMVLLVTAAVFFCASGKALLAGVTSASNFFLIASLLLFFLFLILIIFRKYFLKKQGLLLMINTFFILYLLAEAVFRAALSMGIMNAPGMEVINLSNQKFVEEDTVAGYKLCGKKVRNTEIVDGKLVYDNHFTPNRQGYNSCKDYDSLKSKRVHRYMVFGDSFTAADFLQTPWPDHMNADSIKLADSLHLQLYSFALDGFGLLNWYSVFFKEVAVNYDFDGVIFAVFGDDLSRDFVSANVEDSICYYHKAPVVPGNAEAFRQIRNVRIPFGKIASDPYIDRMIEGNIRPEQSRSLYLCDLITSIFRSRSEQGRRKEAMTDQAYSLNSGRQGVQNKADFVARYSANRYQMLSEMMNWCRVHNKQVIITSIPHQQIVRENRDQNTSNVLQSELEFLSKEFGTWYYNAYPDFQKLDEQRLSDAYFKNDVHWNQEGSDYFAKNFTQFLIGKYAGNTGKTGGRP
jgi:hypothetical protein